MAGNPHPETRSPITDLDLEAQIARAEQRVLLRDRRIKARTSAIVTRVQTRAPLYAGGGLAAMLGTLGLKWWLDRRFPKAPPAPARPSAAEHLARDAGLLATLLPLLWPLMPRKVTRHVSPGLATSVLGLVAPMVSPWVMPWLTPLLERVMRLVPGATPR